MGARRRTVLLVCSALGAGAAAQPCASGWGERFAGDLGGEPRASTAFDDGTGEGLYFGGSFTSAGGVAATYIARWKDHTWTTVGGGVGPVAFETRVDDLAVYDDGGGSRLYAAGKFSLAGGVPVANLARWDGAAWQNIGGTGPSGGHLFALRVWDDGTGPGLYVAGVFESIGGITANSIARWDGQWTPLGSGITTSTGMLTVEDLGMGTGPVAGLYAAGVFTHAGGSPAQNIARWDGSQWSPLGPGLGGFTDTVNAVECYDDGSGPSIVAGGRFSGVGLARWNGSSWMDAWGNAANETKVLRVLTVNGQSSLYAGADYSGVTSIARLTGTMWDGLGDGLSWSDVNAWVNTVAVFDSGDGPQLHAGGRFDRSGARHTLYASRYDGEKWHSLGSGITGAGGGFNPSVLAVLRSGPDLYVGGVFDVAGSTATGISSIARWTGSSWEPVGGGTTGGSVQDLVLASIGGPQALYAGGSFNTIGGLSVAKVARWNGASWAPLANGLRRTTGVAAADALVAADLGQGMSLYVGGYFDQAGTVNTQCVARWNGSAWSALGSGLAGGTNKFVAGLVVFNDGAGNALYAAGSIENTGSTPLPNIARWNGTQWTGVGMGFNASTSALAVFSSGGAPELYAGGSFTQSGATPVSRVARWDGSIWQPLGSGTNDFVRALCVFDDGSGPSLIAGGGFTVAGGGPALGVARWNGSAWLPLDGGIAGSTSPFVGVLYADPAPGPPGLWVGGAFAMAGGASSSRLARWSGCTPCDPDCNRDGALNLSDFGCFQTKFALGDPYADCNGDGVRNLSDFGCFQTKFALGCP